MYPVPNTFTIFQGDDKTMNLKAVYAETGDPLDLTTVTEIDIALPNQDGSFTHRKLSLSEVTITSPAVLGKFSTEVTAIISALLNLGEIQTITVAFTSPGKIITVPYVQALSVFQRN